MLECASRVEGECRLRERDGHSSSLSRTRIAPSGVVLILEDANVDGVGSTLIERATLGRWLEDALEVVSGLVVEKRVFWLCRRNEARPTSAPHLFECRAKEGGEERTSLACKIENFPTLARLPRATLSTTHSGLTTAGFHPRALDISFCILEPERGVELSMCVTRKPGAFL